MKLTDPIKVCFYGPESTGKTTMAREMARLYHTEFVPEVAREMIDSNDFTIDDIIRIGHEQTRRVKEKSKTAHRILFCDSDVITTEIYSQHYLGVIPPVLFELEKQVHYDQYFLFEIDVPWVDDGMRDLGKDVKRQQMFEIFRSELDRRDTKYVRVKGDWVERERIVKHHLSKLLQEC